MTDLALLSAADLAARFADKSLSPVEVTEATLARIDKLNPDLNFFRMVAPDDALAMARASEARWAKGAPLSPIDGVTVSIKDQLYTKGWSTLQGSLSTDPDGPWDMDAPAVAHLRAAGTVFLGKTTTPEFGHKGVTVSGVHGTTRNPWNRDRTPGGSSGGAGVAAAVGGGAVNLGTDGGGSVRLPAAFCGVFGHKATYGRVPNYPPSPAISLSHVGPLTRTVADSALAMNVMARPDARDWYQSLLPVEDYLADLEAGVKGLKIAFAPTMNDEEVSPDVAHNTAAAVEVLKAAGAEVTEVTYNEPGWRDVWMVFWTVNCFMRRQAMTPAQREKLDPTFVMLADMGEKTSLEDYQKAVMDRAHMGSRSALFFEDWDLMVGPALPITAFEIGVNFPGEGTNHARRTFSPFTGLYNMTGQPAASMPTGLGDDGLPTGLHIIGPAGADAPIHKAARVVEKAIPIALPPIATA